MVQSGVFGDLIREKRQKIGLTQSELARRVGCATVTLRKIEYGTLRPSVQIGERLAVALDVPLEDRAHFIHLARAQKPDTPATPTPSPSPRPDEIGQDDLSGKAVRGYQLMDRIGEGGFGIVYRAIQPAVEREVAVKIILPKYANQPEFIRRFENEAQLVARLEHPHIVPLYDYWREPGAAFLVMRLLRGGSLKNSLSDGPPPIAKTLRLLEQIAKGLHAAHRFGVIHRDLKPANILLDDDENAYLADFGIAKNLGNPELEANTQTGALLGSFAYLSPEQIRSESIRPQADIYAFGVLMYQLLTGVLPFQGPTPIDYIQQHLNNPLPLLAEHNPNLPPELDRIIQRATAKKIENRYPDLPSLVADLNESQQDIQELRMSFQELASQNHTDLTEIANPFKGLRPFGEADTEDFFGRESLIQSLLGRLSENEDLSRFLAVVGPSGSGKSSVVRAGMLAAIRRGGLPGSEDWFITDMIPGRHPFEELEAALLRVAVNPPEKLLGQLQESPRGLMRAAGRILPANQAVELLLFIDQFEEIFTLVESEETRELFLESLLTAILDERSRIRIVITLRADFTDRPLQYVDFGELIRQRTEFVLPLNPDELELAVSGPSRRAGLIPEQGLTSRIVRELGEQPGVLPLLQYTLTELFEYRDGRRLTLEAYDKLGGVLGALGERAEDIFTNQDHESREITRQLFLRLVTLGEGNEDTRRRVLRSELEALAPENPELVTKSLEIFGRFRLLSYDHDPATRNPTVELSHEALIREWPRLRGWLDESRSDLRAQRILARDAASWRNSGKDDSFLLRGARLDQYETWKITSDLALTTAEKDFLAASLARREREELKEKKRLEREKAQEQRSRSLLRALVIVFAFAAVIAVALYGYALSQQKEAVANADLANRNAATAIAAENLAQEEAIAALKAENLAIEEAARADAAAEEALTSELRAEEEAQAAIESYAISLAALSQETLRDSDSATALALAFEALNIIGPEDPPNLVMEAIVSAAFAPGARTVVPFADDKGNPLSIWSVALSSDETFALVGLEDGRTVKIDPFSGEVLNTYQDSELSGDPTGQTDVYRVVISPDQTHFIAAHGDGYARYWDLETGAIEFRLFAGEGYVYDVDIHPEGQIAVTGGSAGYLREDWDTPGLISLWDLNTGERIQILEDGHDNAVLNTSFTPDGKSLISTQIVSTGASDDPARRIMIWNLETGQYDLRFGTSPLPFFKPGIFADSTMMLAPTREQLDLFDLNTGELLDVFEGHERDVVKVVISADQTKALSVAVDGLIILWDTTNGEILQKFIGNDFDHVRIADVIFGPGEETALSVSEGGTLIIWDLASAGEIRRFVGHDAPILDLEMLPDGNNLLSSSGNIFPGQTDGEDNTIRLWDIETGDQLRVFNGHENTVVAIDFSETTNQIISVSYDGTMRLWDFDTSEQLAIFDEHPLSPPWDVAFHPDGRHAITGYAQGVVAYWDLITGEFRTLKGHPDENSVFGVTIHPDGERAFGVSTGLVILWDLATGAEIGKIEYPGMGGIVEITADGKYAFVGSGLENLTVWDLETLELVTSFTEQQGNIGNNSLDIAADNRTAISVSWFGSVYVWDLMTGDIIRTFPGHDAIATGSAISPDGRYAFSGAGDKVIIQWAITPPDINFIMDWIDENRVVREFECSERVRLNLAPCEAP